MICYDDYLGQDSKSLGEGDPVLELNLWVYFDKRPLGQMAQASPAVEPAVHMSPRKFLS